MSGRAVPDYQPLLTPPEAERNEVAQHYPTAHFLTANAASTAISPPIRRQFVAVPNPLTGK